ncbi:unnamed protein product [Phytophthora fragariaefolia]|uniref:Unnamed protein product n=1 Tax=Phytophthora fragariaefolia TaxID=1490495 RepID=A0A9W6XXJ0_9STRA|nr:unnamed protein product [Phytophthora fragariaefolia]
MTRERSADNGDADSDGDPTESQRSLFRAGDQVWLFMERVRSGLKKKLAHRWHGPFRVKSRKRRVKLGAGTSPQVRVGDCALCNGIGATATKSTPPDGWRDEFFQEHSSVMMNWLQDLLDHLESGTQVPAEWQTVITVMATDNPAFQAPPFVQIDATPDNEDDEETKNSEPPAA